MPIIDESSLSELLLKDAGLRLIEPHIYSVMQEQHGESANFFNNLARFYDLVICNPLYNRLVWGYSVKSFATLVHDALASSKDGWVLDAGCGSLAFAAKTYAKYAERPVVLLDQSLNLLRIAKARLTALNGGVPANMVFFQGDALQLPFKPGSFNTIVSLNLLHVLDDAKKALSGLKNVLTEKGTISLTTLVQNNRCADRYLEVALKKTSGTAPRNIERLHAVFDDLEMPVKCHVDGNMAFIRYGWNS